MKKLLVVAALFCFMTDFGYAAEWNFYGSARVNTTYTKMDNDPFSSNAAILGLGVGSDTKNFEQKLFGNARIGAKVKVSDELTGHFEYGALGGRANLRVLWGEWDFGAGSLGVGKQYTPLLFPYSNQTYSLNGLNKGDHNMSSFGMLYGRRKAQIQLKFGGFQIAAVRPDHLVSLTPNLTGIGMSQPDTEVLIPSIQAKYKYDFSNGHVAVAAGYHTFDVLANSSEYSVDQYVLGLGGRLDVGAAYFKANIWGGQNVGNLARILVNGSLFSTVANAGKVLDGDGLGYAQWDGKSVNDKDAIGALIVAGYKIQKGLYLEAGYGYVSTELDIAGAEKDDSETYYLQATIFLAPGVFLTPEIGRVDMKQTNQPDATYCGIKWQVNF